MNGEPHVSAQARILGALDDLFKRLGPPKVDICDCGQEKQPGEDHSMCYPGM